MVTDQQHRETLRKIDELERKLNLLSRSMAELTMKYNSMPKSRVEFEEERKKDVTLYIFDGRKYKKRNLVLACIKKFIDDNKTIEPEELFEIFPDYIQGSLGVIRKAEEAEKYEDSKNRYFFNDEDVISIGGNTYVVCKEWSVKNINRFLEVADTLGYKIEVISR